jgi:putative transposase
MEELFKNKYRISSARLQSWDYGDNGMYFVTICTANRESFFGNIVETQCIASLPNNTYAEPEYSMELNDLGKVVEIEWLKTKELRPDMNLELEEFVVMPNHFHGIIYIGENGYNTQVYNNGRDTMHRVSTTNANIDEYQSDNQKNKFGPQAKNLASVIRGFKSVVTTYAIKNNHPFNWQTRFHDHIISTNKEYLNIADYIINNPKNWPKDEFH